MMTGIARHSLAAAAALILTAGPIAGTARADIFLCDRLAGLQLPWRGNGESPSPGHGPPFHRLDPAQAIPACTEALGELPDHPRVHFQLGRALDKAERWDEAAPHYRRAAEDSYAPAQAHLGRLYEDGRGVPREPETAMRWYRLASNQGYAAADAAIGALYLDGRGVRMDQREAAKWIGRAAERGDGPAQLLYGWLFQQGRGVPRDDMAAAEWIGRAAEQGDPAAETAYALLFQEGRGVPKDLGKAAEWFRRAADQGDATAQSQLGWAYEQGLGLPTDDAKAAEWYLRAAHQGSAEAQRNVAWLYQRGRGVKQDFATAAHWYQASAKQGDARAQVALGWLHEQAMGVPQDDSAAERLYRAAARQGFWQAQNALAWFLVSRGRDFPEALRLARAAASQQPRSGDVLDTLGFVLFKTGRLEEAVIVLEKATTLEAVEPATIREHLGDVYKALGRADAARGEWRRALADDAPVPHKVRLEQKLKGD